MAAAMRITNKFLKITNKFNRFISQLSTCSPANPCLQPCTKINHLSLHGFPRMETNKGSFIWFESTNTIDEMTKAAEEMTMSVQEMTKLAEEMTKGGEEMAMWAEETNKAIEETNKDLCLECWTLGHELHKKGGDPEKVAKYCEKAKEIMEGCKDSDVSAPAGIVHGWPFAIAGVNRLLGIAYLDLKKYDESWHRLFDSAHILQELPEEECVLQSLLQTQLEQVKLAICENKYTGRKIRDILETKEKMMQGCIELGEAYKHMCIVYLDDYNSFGALPFALKALEIYTQHLGDNSVAVAQLRGLLGYIYFRLNELDKALEQNKLSHGILRNTTQTAVGLLKGEIEYSDRLVALDRYEEAIDVLESVVSHPEIKGGERAIAFVSMARAFCFQKKHADARKYLETARKILEEEEIPTTYSIIGFLVMAKLYGQKMYEYETAISLLRTVLLIPKLPIKLFAESSEDLCSLISPSKYGYEKKEISYLQDCVKKLKRSFGPKVSEAGFIHGYGYETLAIINMYHFSRTESAVKFMEYAKQGKDASLASPDKDSIQATQNLSLAYASIGSYDLAIACQEKAVEGLALERKEPRIIKKLGEATRLLTKFKEMASANDSHSSVPRNENVLW